MSVADTTNQHDVRTVALAAHDAGMCVLPIRSDGTKKTTLHEWKSLQTQRPTRAQVEAWFGPHRAVGVICGAISGGLMMLEMEGAFYDEGYWSAFRAAVLERLSAERWAEITAYVELSPSGGPHLYMRCPGFDDGNEKLAKAMRANPKTGVIEPTDIMETRGDGGYSVIAGSVGHETGKAWTVAKGGSIADVATVTRDELELILEAARTLDEVPSPEPIVEPPRTPKERTGDSWMDATIEDYNRKHGVLDLLPGWTAKKTENYQGGQVVRVHREGSSNRQGASIYGSGRIGFFSSNAPHGCEYWDGKSKHITTYDAFSLSLILSGKRGTIDERVEYALVALSTACAGKVDVDGINYRQPSNIYLAIIAASGIGKSPVAARMLQPLYDLEERLAQEAKESIATAMSEESAIEEQINAAKQQLKKDPASRYARDAMRDAELARLSHEVPATPRLIADDHTPEALGHLIAGQKGTRMAVLSPEGATLFSSMTGQRYKSGDAPPEVPPVYLKSWGGEPMPIDRKGSPSITVKRPILTVGVLVQPFVVDRLAMTPQIAAQGGLARFLWIVAEDNVGRRDRSRRRHVAPLSPDYIQRLTAMARLCASWQYPTCMTATEEAADHLDVVNHERERRMGLGGDLDAYREIEAKIVGYQWRLACLLAMAHEDERGAGITLERAKQAEVLADYFLAHSIAVHRRAGLDERGGTLRAAAAYISKHAGEELDWRDFQLSTRNVYGQLSEAQADLAELERMRWITIEEGELASVGVRGAKNPVVKVDARTRAFSAGSDAP